MRNHTNARVQSVTPSHATALANAIYSLDEPWRTRFLDLIALRAQAALTNPPSKEEVTGWLLNRGLYREMNTLFRTWTHQ